MLLIVCYPKSLTIKAPITAAAGNTFSDILLTFEGNKTLYTRSSCIWFPLEVTRLKTLYATNTRWHFKGLELIYSL